MAACSLLAAISVTNLARAGNDEGLLLGNQAALTGGAVTATIAEGSAVWYNPAGVAGVKTDSVDVSVSAYGVRLYSAPHFLVGSNGQSAPVRVTELVIVPTGVAYVRPLSPDLRLGFGLFAPKSNDLILRADLDSSTDGRWLVTEAQYDRLSFAGVSLAWAARRGLRFGGALFAFYRFQQTEIQFAGGIPTGSQAPVAFGSFSSTETRTTLGGMASIGVQWDATPEWHLGLSVRSPAANFFSNGVSNAFVTSSVAATNAQGEPINLPAYLPESTTRNRSQFTLTAPPELRWGVSRSFESGWVALDGDFSTALPASTGNQLDPKFNLRLGGMLSVADTVVLGAGLFTDRGAEVQSETNGGPIHYYGATLGVQWGRVYRIADVARPRSFDFTTSLALRYAYGAGQTNALRVSAVDIGEPGSEPMRSTLTINEITLQLGSGFYF